MLGVQIGISLCLHFPGLCKVFSSQKKRHLVYTLQKNLHTVVTTFDCTFLLLIENNSLSLLEWPFWRDILTVNIIGVTHYAVFQQVIKEEVTAGNYLELLHLEITCLYVCGSAITLDIFSVEIWGESLKQKYYGFTVFFIYVSIYLISMHWSTHHLMILFYNFGWWFLQQEADI